MAEETTSTSNGGGLKRVLGPIDATCVVVGAIIGVGIFFTPKEVATIAGSGGMAMLAWTVGGVIALLGALTFAELGSIYPHTGGQYEILRDAYGPLPAFLFVFCNATAVQAGAVAIIAIICAQNIGVAAAGAAPESVSLLILALVLIIGLTAANIVGVKWGATIQNFTVYAKVTTLIVVTLLATTVSGDGAGWTASQPASAAALGPVAVIFAALVPAFFSYGGWQQALWIAGEVRQPRKNIPIAIVGGVLLVVLVYLMANWAYLKLLGFDGVKESSTLAADAVAVVWPSTGRRIVAGAVAISAFGVLNAQLLAGPRLICRMAADGRFFSLFARVSTRFATPVPAIALLAGASVVLLFATARFEGVGKLLTGVVFIDGVFFALTGGALFVIRRRRQDAARLGRSFGYPLAPFLFVMGELGIVAGAFAAPQARESALVAAGWIAAAAVVYLLFFRGGRRTVD